MKIQNISRIYLTLRQYLNKTKRHVKDMKLSDLDPLQWKLTAFLLTMYSAFQQARISFSKGFLVRWMWKAYVLTFAGCHLLVLNCYYVIIIVLMTEEMFII